MPLEIEQNNFLPLNQSTIDTEELEATGNNIAGLEQTGVDPFDAPIPGESLTGDPENPKPWETPPTFTDPDKAVQAIFDMLTADEAYEQLLDSLRDGLPIDMLTQVLLYKGFEDGYWTPDLMLLLIEPTAYIIMWLADYNEIDAVLDSDDPDWDPDKEDEEDEKLRVQAKEDIKRMKPPSDKVPPSLLAKMDEFSPDIKGEV